MGTCTFFGHRECFSLEREVLKRAIENQINKGVDTFYVGHQGEFDRMVFGCLKDLQEQYSHIAFSVVLTQLPAQKQEFDQYSIYPEGLEMCPPRFAIDCRNRWLVDHAEICICYINHSWGGAYKYAQLARRRGLLVLNLGDKSVICKEI